MLNEETIVRTSSQRNTIISKMKKAGYNGVTNVELKDISLNYTARISELRKSGYRFSVDDLGGGVFKYILIHEPIEKKVQDKAIDIFWKHVEWHREGDVISVSRLRDILDDNNFNVVRNWGCNI